MTREKREDAIKFFEEVAKKEVNNAKYSKLAIEALEQEPIIDKIRAEIVDYKLSEDELSDMDEDSVKWGMAIAIELLDKYKAESEK